MARAEGSIWNEGVPASPCRTNCEGQAGTEAQRKEAPPGSLEVGWDHSIEQQSRPAGTEAQEGSHRETQSAQATRTVRTTEQDWQTFLRNIAEKARTKRHHRFGDLYRWLNQDVLRLCFYRLRKDAASGVDRVSFQAYESHLEANLTDLEGRLKRKAYRARLVRRKYIPKGQGKFRPLEDKLLQVAVTHILMAIYEQDFLRCSYGYRPHIGALDAVDKLTIKLQFGRYNWVVEADIKGFFDNIDHDWMIRMLAERIDDWIGGILLLIIPNYHPRLVGPT